MFESLEDRRLLTILVTNTNDDGPGSLRQAIVDANTATVAEQIAFQIPASDPGFVDVDNGSGLFGSDADADVFRIALASNLPALNNSLGQPIRLDATTQTASTGDTNPHGPEIELDGSAFWFAEMTLHSAETTLAPMPPGESPCRTPFGEYSRLPQE